jgi:hypothetical protein
VGAYDNYRARVQATLTDSEYINEDNKNLVIENFFNQPNYYSITKNSDAVTHYDVLIAEENKKDNIVGFKKLISYPYTTTQFAIGDYINWGSEIWMLTTLDEQYDYSVGGKIIKTNAYLKWRDVNNVLISYPCIKGNKATYTGLEIGKDVVLPRGEIIVQVQDNVYTSDIKESKRFIIDGKAYEVQFLHVIDGLLELYMGSAGTSAYDDLVNDIANDTNQVYTLAINQDNFNQIISYTSTLSAVVKLNGDIVSEGVTWSSSAPTKVSINASTGVITCLAVGSSVMTAKMTDNPLILDTITINVVASTTPVADIRIARTGTTQSLTADTLFQGDTQIYTVYNYENNVATADTFTFTVSGADSASYVKTDIGGNSFSIQNVETDDTALAVLCTNNVDATTKTIEITLGGLW